MNRKYLNSIYKKRNNDKMIEINCKLKKNHKSFIYISLIPQITLGNKLTPHITEIYGRYKSSIHAFI